MKRRLNAERSHEVATTCSCRNWPELLADNVAFTGRGRTGDGLDERHAGACWPGAMRPLWRHRAVDAVLTAPPRSALARGG
ncbi:hypothetical protein L1887_52482 [Cichorium endivia]|nr:hypothetical protein L1887_52482 [Cichorium endivia]